MGKFKRDNKKPDGGFNRSFGNNKSFGNRHSGSRPLMHQATCNECGNDCEVPFRPTGERPVFCNNCFGKQNQAGGRPNKFGRGRRERSSFGDKQMHDAICDKCGNACQVPFRPTAGKPIYCNNCFDKSGNTSGKNSGFSAEELKAINKKLDMIMDALGLSGSAIAKAKPAKKEVEKKAKKEKKIKEAKPLTDSTSSQPADAPDKKKVKKPKAKKETKTKKAATKKKVKKTAAKKPVAKKKISAKKKK